MPRKAVIREPQAMNVLGRDDKSPYLVKGRLPDLLAAIQAMAIYERYRRSVSDWADLISGDKDSASHWKEIFDDHPEFFRPSVVHPGDYSLVWRRAGNSRYHRRLGKIMDQVEVDLLPEEERRRYITRPPVPEGQIKTLLDTAINLHQHATEAQRDRRWWITPVTAIVSTIGSFAGAIVGALIKVT